MKYRSTMVLMLFLLPTVYGYQAAFPCTSYTCQDTSHPAFQCPQGLAKITGWCTGPAHIQLCAPPGTPPGPYVNKELAQKIYRGEYSRCGSEQMAQQVKTADFKVSIDGNTNCGYWVENNGIRTREKTPIACDSEATITVGPTGDCRQTGECAIWSDGGIFGFEHRVETVEVSITACKAPYEKYTCMNTAACRAAGGTSKTLLCPGSREFQCCIIGEEVFDSGTVFDTAQLLTNDAELERALTSLFRAKNIRVVIETIDAIGQDPATLVATKFRSQYNLRTMGTPAFNLVILYAKKENRFLMGHAKGCGLTDTELRRIIELPSITGSLQQGQYNQAFQTLVSELQALLTLKDPATISCNTQTVAPDCGKCGESWGGVLGCSESSCQQLGCTYNKKYELCTDVEITESLTTIQERLNAVRANFKGFVRKDPLCLGANCALYVTRAHDYIFGTGKRFITGVQGNAWTMPASIQAHDGRVQWFNWRNGEVFREYDQLLPGDIIGLYYAESDYLPEKKGSALGNTPDIDFTHVALYLGKRSDGHVITHLYHPTGSSADPVRTETIESFFKHYGSLFKIRSVMRPEQERLYRTVPPHYRPVFVTAKIGLDPVFDTMVPGASEQEKDKFKWLTAQYNSLVENLHTNRYAGRTIRIPQVLPQGEYSHEYVGDFFTDAEERIINDLDHIIKTKYSWHSNDARTWAAALVRHAKVKRPEIITLTATFADRESQFNPDPGGIKEIASKFIFQVSEFFGNKEQGPTLGCFQLRYCKALDIAARTGRDKTKVYDEMRTIDGCVFYGTKYVEEIIDLYAPNGQLNDEAIYLISADFHAGAYASRNAAIQKQLNEILGTSLAMDGDLLAYDQNCPPGIARASNTELAIRTFLKAYKIPISDLVLREMLKKEKTKEFENTQIYEEIKSHWKAMYQRDPLYAIVAHAPTRSGESSSQGYALVTRDFYNSYCSQLQCQEPPHIIAQINPDGTITVA